MKKWELIEFTGEMDAELELWLGDAFNSWLPTQNGLEVYLNSGTPIILSPGWWIARADDGELMVFPHGDLFPIQGPEEFRSWQNRITSQCPICIGKWYSRQRRVEGDIVTIWYRCRVGHKWKEVGTF